MTLIPLEIFQVKPKTEETFWSSLYNEESLEMHWTSPNIKKTNPKFGCKTVPGYYFTS